MPYRPPKNFPQESNVEVHRDDSTLIVVPSDHPTHAGEVIGMMYKEGDHHYVVNAVHDDSERAIRYFIGRYTSPEYAIASIHYFEGRLTKRNSSQINCPYCNELVRCVTQENGIYLPVPRVINNESQTFLADEYHDHKWRMISGYTIHKCERDDS